MFTQLKLLFSTNKGILIPLIPLVLFLVVFISLLLIPLFAPTRQSPQKNQQIPNPTSLPSGVTQSPSQAPTQTPEEVITNPSIIEGEITLYEDNPKLEKKETLPDGSIKYYFTTATAGRPDIVIAKGVEQNTVFERTVIAQSGKPILLSEYVNFFGKPEKIVSGSKFYGPDAQTYIYAQSHGSAFIVNSKTNRVLELHTFAPMSVDQYIQKFGEDISSPNP